MLSKLRRAPARSRSQDAGMRRPASALRVGPLLAVLLAVNGTRLEAADAAPSPPEETAHAASLHPLHDEPAAPLPARPDSDSPYRLDPAYRLPSAAATTPLPAAPPALTAGTAAASELERKPYARQIHVAARAAGLDPALVHAVIAVESAYQADAVSAKGAVGLMQVLPATAALYGISNPSRVDDNLRAGTRHLRRLMDAFNNRLDLVLAAYNAGEGAVKRYNNAIPPFAETRQYVPAVIGRYQGVASSPAIQPTTAPAARTYMTGTRLNAASLARGL